MLRAALRFRCSGRGRRRRSVISSKRLGLPGACRGRRRQCNDRQAAVLSSPARLPPVQRCLPGRPPARWQDSPANSGHGARRPLQNCSRKLTLQTYFVDPHTSHTGIVFCKKCGPVHAPKVDVEAAEFKRMQKLKGGRLINDQVRQGVSKQAK